MQGAHESTRSGDDSPRAGLLSPLRAFLLLIVALGAAGLLLSLNRPDTPAAPTNPPPAEPDYSLTDAEALTRFRELDQLKKSAYTNRDTTLISLYLTHDSPLRKTNEEEIRQLLDDGVLFDPNQKTRSVAITLNSSDEVRIRQVLELNPKFTDEAGQDVSTGRRIVQTIVWSLRPEHSLWKIHDADVIRTRPLK